MAPVKDRRISLGQWGENKAADYMIHKGFTLIDRNARSRYGELDLVMGKEGLVVFVEVKTRSSSSFGMPEISVSSRKQRHLIDSALSYMQLHPEVGEHWRIDVVAIQKKGPGDGAEIVHFEDAVH